MNIMNCLAEAFALLLIPAASYDETAIAGDSIDILDYDGACLIILNASLGTGTTPTLNAIIEHSDDDITFTPVTAGAFVQVTGAAGAGLQTILLNAANLKRYVHILPTIAGTTPDFVYSAEFVGVKKAS
jgi:hypothetical protein